MTNEEYGNYLKSDAWKQKAEERLRIDSYRCRGCGTCGTTVNPLEVHHMSYVHIGNERVYEELITLCHGCHKLVHKMMERPTNSDGRLGWKDNPRIPTCHVFTVSGSELNYIEED